MDYDQMLRLQQGGAVWHLPCLYGERSTELAYAGRKRRQSIGGLNLYAPIGLSVRYGQAEICNEPNYKHCPMERKHHEE
jgi:hypothetical protein